MRGKNARIRKFGPLRVSGNLEFHVAYCSLSGNALEPVSTNYRLPFHFAKNVLAIILVYKISHSLSAKFRLINYASAFCNFRVPT